MATGVLVDFLQGAVHQILYARKVYPPDVFERRRLFDVTVFRSRHVELNDYIKMVVDSARLLLERAELDALVVSVLGRPRAAAPSLRPVVLERFRLDVRLSAAGASSHLDAEGLAASLRGFLLKLHVCDALLAPLPADAELSFTAELHTRATSAPHPLPDSLREAWAETDAGGGGAHTAAGPVAGGVDGGPHVVPLKSLEAGGLTMGLSVLTARAPIAA